MAKIVNLRQARKTKRREKDRARADENSVRFGRTLAQRRQEEAEARKARDTLDAHRREE